MTDIPDDIMKSVQAAWEKAWSKTGNTNAESIRDALAIAITTERHRCAVIARQWKETQHKSEQYAANTIADRIMAGDAA